MSFTLRPYQAAASAAGVAYLTDPKKAGRNGIIVEPPGAGKSLIIADIVAALDGPTIVFQPKKEILIQNREKFAHYGYKVGVWSASMGRKELRGITLATIGSVIRHPDVFRHVQNVLIDEADVVNAKFGMYKDFLTLLAQNADGSAKKPPLRILGLTATPYRLASNSFGTELRVLTRTNPRVFNDVVHITEFDELLRDGYLCPLVYRDAQAIDRSRLKINGKGADYTDASVQQQLFETGFVGRLQGEVLRALEEGRKNVLVYTRFVNESERLAASVPGCEVVTAETPDGQRRDILERFKSGQTTVLTNVGIVAIGTDFPAAECVILGRPTLSLALFYQQIGRVVRPVYAAGMPLTTPDDRRAAMASGPKPVAYVVDMVGSSKLFGRVEDIHITFGGERENLMTVCSGGRALTNTLLHDLHHATLAERGAAQADLFTGHSPFRGLPPAIRKSRYFAKRARKVGG